MPDVNISQSVREAIADRALFFVPRLASSMSREGIVFEDLAKACKGRTGFEQHPQRLLYSAFTCQPVSQSRAESIRLAFNSLLAGYSPVSVLDEDDIVAAIFLVRGLEEVMLAAHISEVELAGRVRLSRGLIRNAILGGRVFLKAAIALVDAVCEILAKDGPPSNVLGPAEAIALGYRRRDYLSVISANDGHSAIIHCKPEPSDAVLIESADFWTDIKLKVFQKWSW